MNHPTLYRQYTLTGEKDFNDVIFNRQCPEYALSWNDELNIRFWPINHDFKRQTFEKRKLNKELICIIGTKLMRIFKPYKETSL